MNKKNIIYTAFMVMLTMSCQSHQDTNMSVVQSPPVQQQNKFYTGNLAPLKPLHFIKLSTRNIKPESWLREVLKRQRDGMTGHLEQISAWLQKKIMPLA